jgi:hypothetical protein
MGLSSFFAWTVSIDFQPGLAFPDRELSGTLGMAKAFPEDAPWQDVFGSQKILR